MNAINQKRSAGVGGVGVVNVLPKGTLGLNVNKPGQSVIGPRKGPCASAIRILPRRGRLKASGSDPDLPSLDLHVPNQKVLAATRLPSSIA